jgi:hypothetical protein
MRALVLKRLLLGPLTSLAAIVLLFWTTVSQLSAAPMSVHTSMPYPGNIGLPKLCMNCLRHCSSLYPPAPIGSRGKVLTVHQFLSFWACSNYGQWPNNPYVKPGNVEGQATWTINRNIVDVLITSISILHHSLNQSFNLLAVNSRSIMMLC